MVVHFELEETTHCLDKEQKSVQMINVIDSIFVVDRFEYTFGTYSKIDHGQSNSFFHDITTMCSTVELMTYFPPAWGNV